MRERLKNIIEDLGKPMSEDILLALLLCIVTGDRNFLVISRSAQMVSDVLDKVSSPESNPGRLTFNRSCALNSAYDKLLD
jgi:DNA-binding phage protein